jgi:hypothetical protein
MRSLKELNKYLIFTGNEEVIYKKINKDEFVAYYTDSIGLYTHIDKYYFRHYSKFNYKYIRNNELQSVMRNNYKVFDLWKKYFGN